MNQEPNGTNKIADWQLRQRQSLPLDLKVELSLRRIRDWCDHWDDMVYVAFSGGLDSTVLLHLVRSVLPDCPGVFNDTGLEFPEIRDFVKTFDNITWMKPKMTHPEVLKTYGFPVVSKQVSQSIDEARRFKPGSPLHNLRTKGIKKDGSKASSRSKIPDKWMYLLDAPFDISQKCCDVFKKEPAHRYEKETGRKVFVGTRTEEGLSREINYLQYGCNGYDMARPRSTPLSFWLDADIKQYIKENNIPYSPIYDMGYDRTGCVFCMYGCHLEGEKNRFQKLEETHPKLHNYCMNKLGLKDILQYIGVNPYNTQLDLFAGKENEN